MSSNRIIGTTIILGLLCISATLAQECNWTGEWQTIVGNEPMTLKQSGEIVTGTYKTGENLAYGGPLEGNVSGNKLIGTAIGNNGPFDFEFTISADCNSLKGKWRSGAAWYDGWDFTRISGPSEPPKPPVGPETGTIDLTGVWDCDDGGRYYIRQSGDAIWWLGEPSTNPGGWSNVAEGTVSDNTIKLDWSDVPKGCTLNKGTLVLNILSKDKLTATEKSGGFGGSTWTRVASTTCPSSTTTTSGATTIGTGTTITPPGNQGLLNPWEDPNVHQLIDEWLLQADRCVKKVYPGAYISKWGWICGSTTTANIRCLTPDHPADWDNYHYLWYNNLLNEYYSYSVRDYVSLRQSGESFESLANGCKSKENYGTTKQVGSPLGSTNAGSSSSISGQVNPFGSRKTESGSLRGDIYYLPEGTSALPDFSSLNPVGSIYTKVLDIPQRSFTNGFPGITDKFEWFAIRYTGSFKVDREGDYAFRLVSDDGSRLFIDGNLIIDNDGTHPPKSVSGNVYLSNGMHQLEVDFFQGPREYLALQLFWTPPSGSEVIANPEYVQSSSSIGSTTGGTYVSPNGKDMYGKM
jgi:hypothetical protein